MNQDAPPSKGTSKLAVACLVFIGLGVFCAGGFALFLKQGKAEIDPVVKPFLARVQGGDYAGAYALVGAPLKKIQTEKDFVDSLQLVEEVLGRLQSKTTTGFNLKRLTSGSVASLSYAGTFTKGQGTIKLALQESGGVWEITSWRVESPLFVKALTCQACNHVSKEPFTFCAKCGVERGKTSKTDAAKTDAAKTDAAKTDDAKTE